MPALLDLLPAPGCGGHDAEASQAPAAQPPIQQLGNEGFAEVQLVLRMPRAAPPPGGGRFGSISEMEALIEQLQGLLEAKERQRQVAVDAYNRRVSCQDRILEGWGG